MFEKQQRKEVSLLEKTGGKWVLEELRSEGLLNVKSFRSCKLWENFEEKQTKKEVLWSDPDCIKPEAKPGRTVSKLFQYSKRD